MTAQPLLKITYDCPQCSHTWHDLWSAACDAPCEECGARDVQASDWTEVEAVEDRSFCHAPA